MGNKIKFEFKILYNSCSDCAILHNNMNKYAIKPLFFHYSSRHVRYLFISYVKMCLWSATLDIVVDGSHLAVQIVK